MRCKDCSYYSYSWEYNGEDERPYYYCTYHKVEVYRNQGRCREFEGNEEQVK